MKLERARSAWVLLPLVPLVAACGSEADIGSGSGALRVATYNTGLAPALVDYVDERAPHTTRAIAGVPLDVLCVQEVWRAEDVERMRADAADTLPDAFFLPPDPGPAVTNGPACSQADAGPLIACAQGACSSASRDQLAACVLESCRAQLEATPEPCQVCLASNAGGTLEQAAAACLSGGPASAYAYGGSFGLGLLTNADVVETGSLVLTSSIERKAVLYEKLETSALGELDVFCTHLSSNLPGLPNPEGRTWAEEQAAQIDALLAFIDEKTGEGAHVLLLGDMNDGPAAGEATAELPANWQKLLAAGFTPEYASRPDATCTFCADNPLVHGPFTEDRSVLIDHVLVRGFEPRVDDATRILTEPLTITTVNGQHVTTAYSDHYGVRAELSPP